MVKVITSISYDAALLPHFVRYYRSLGVDGFVISICERAPGILKKTKRIAATLDAHIEIVPASERELTSGLEGNNKEEVRRLHIAPGDWIIPADLDEFIQFPAPISELIAEMNATDATFLMGRFCDRLAPDGVLAPTLDEPSIWEQYPIASRVSELLVCGYDHKITLCRGDCELTSGHHNVLRPARPLVTRHTVVHHFKWRQGILEGLQGRVDRYKKANYGAWPESQRAIDYINLHGRIIPEDFDGMRGWRPDAPEITEDTVVYTAITEGYDLLKPHGFGAPAGTSFVAFTGDLRSRGGWQVRPLHTGFDDPCRNAKIHKILPHLYFPDAKYSLWVDGSVRFKPGTRIVDLIATYLAEHDLAVFQHPRRTCIYQEAEECIMVDKDDPEIIRTQMRRYRYEGYPELAGLAECTLILRRHTEKMNAFNEVWWEEISRHSRRDQLSFNYAARKMDVRYCTIPGSAEQNHFSERLRHLPEQALDALQPPPAPVPEPAPEPVACPPAIDPAAEEMAQIRNQLFATGQENYRLHQELRSINVRYDKMASSKIWLLVLPFRKLEQSFRACRKAAVRTFRSLFQPASIAEDGETDYQRWLRLYDKLMPGEVKRIRAKIAAFPRRPLISVLMPTYNTPGEFLRKSIESVRGQIYREWELCIADDASTEPHVREMLLRYQQLDPRIKVTFRNENGRISEASNSALALATGEYAAMLDHDDELAPRALYAIAEALQKCPDADLIYTDYDKLSEDGNRHSPYFKTDWNPDLLLSHNYICHLAAYRVELMRDVGGLRAGLEGSQDWDLSLRVTEKSSPARIIHIPRVLYHWRQHSQSTALSLEAKPYALLAAERAVRDHLERTGKRAQVLETQFPGWLRVRYELKEEPRVSIIVCTRDRVDLLIPCITSVLQKTEYTNYEILIVDNDSRGKETLEYFKHLQGEPRVRIIKDDQPFNYSALNNHAVSAATGEVVCFLNNDVEVISGDWLSEMVSHAMRGEIGAVGAKLLYPDNRVQHVGIVLGMRGVGAHPFSGLGADEPGYMGRAQLIQNYTAVTGACLVVRKKIFEEIGGFNPSELGVNFNDIDLCLKIHAAGYHNLWTPYALLYHHESASRGQDLTNAKATRATNEMQYMKQRWNGMLLADPAYNPNLSLDELNYDLAFPPRNGKS